MLKEPKRIIEEEPIAQEYSAGSVKSITNSESCSSWRTFDTLYFKGIFTVNRINGLLFCVPNLLSLLLSRGTLFNFQSPYPVPWSYFKNRNSTSKM